MLYCWYSYLFLPCFSLTCSHCFSTSLFLAMHDGMIIPPFLLTSRKCTTIMQCCRCELGVGTQACGRLVWRKPTSLVSHCLYLLFLYIAISCISCIQVSKYYFHYMLFLAYRISCIQVSKNPLDPRYTYFLFVIVRHCPISYISSPPFTVYSISVDRGRGLGSLAVGYIWGNFLHEFGGVGTPIPVRRYL